jgi:hypothetical protein
MSLFNAKILEIWIVYIFDVYHQHGQDKSLVPNTSSQDSLTTVTRGTLNIQVTDGAYGPFGDN